MTANFVFKTKDEVIDLAGEQYKKNRIKHWDRVACKMDHWRGWGGYYHKLLLKKYAFLIPQGKRVLEIGCGIGDLLSGLRPSFGVGIDFSSEMILRAKKKHPQLFFFVADALDFQLKKRFDYIIISDLLNDVWDIQTVLLNIKKVVTARTRIIINCYSRLWEPIIKFAEKVGLAQKTLPQNWILIPDLINLLNLSGFDVVRHWREVLFPLPIPLLKTFFNRFFVKIWPINHFALSNFVVSRPYLTENRFDKIKKPRVSVIVPVRNEAGNIGKIFKRTPELGSGTELIFVEGHSRDDSYSVIEKMIAVNPKRKCKLFRQTGTGKGDAVRLGFQHASGDILMILDADLTVPPEDLIRFFSTIMSDKGELINGVRLVYPMEKFAMRFFNILGNKFFSLAFSWLIGQSIKDTLCGTKVLWKSDYEQIASNRDYFGDFDPFGDFDLIFGAAKMSLKIVDLPIHYRERSYGKTNIQRWKHGWLLLRMVFFAAFKIKFI